MDPKKPPFWVSVQKPKKSAQYSLTCVLYIFSQNILLYYDVVSLRVAK